MRGEIVILCIGSNQVVGDSVGPMVGDYLKKTQIQAYVYGTMTRPVNAKNLKAYGEMIREHHANALLIVVDSTVGNSGDVGEVRITKNGVKPGGAAGKNIPRIGDIGILGVVGKKGGSLVSTLMNVDISVVECLSIKIGGLLKKAIG